MEQRIVMPGVNSQALGVHSGDMVAYKMSVDRRDCWPLNNPIALPHELTCTHLVHFTENVSAERIGRTFDEVFTFQPRLVPITNAVSFRLTWWSPLPPNNWEEVIDANLPNVDKISCDIGNSPAFNGRSLCGPMGIQVSWQDILASYAYSRQSDPTNIEMRVLGTFKYNMEIMYVVLVCIGGDAEVESFPLIDAVGTEAFARKSATDFVWKVYCTIGYNSDPRPQGITWTWDHLSFAFNCPTSNLDIRNGFCGIRCRFATDHIPSSRSNGNRRSQTAVLADGRIVNDLRTK